ncbi:MAG TPA: serine hydrolase domain-containing protein, partial [Bryobacteraceae bacterium]|nr:serine hydrolase domain-containing protein [Bryobacteraceae bacterium]
MAHSQVPVLLPDCAQPVTLPGGWAPVAHSIPLALIGPEEDLRVVLAVAPNTASMDEIAANTWHRADTSFNYPILQQAEMPSSRGWDKVCQIVYNTPAAESRAAFAIIRILNGQAYISLISGSKGAFSRRMAQVSEILEAWKPVGLSTISLATRPQCAWGDQQSRELSQFVQDAMAKLFIPGASIAIVQQGRMVYAEGFGVCKTGGSERVTPTTRFKIGSSTKPLTTLMMARLIDQGAFTWNTPVRELLPNFE